MYSQFLHEVRRDFTLRYPDFSSFSEERVSGLAAGFGKERASILATSDVFQLLYEHWTYYYDRQVQVSGLESVSLEYLMREHLDIAIQAILVSDWKQLQKKEG